MSDTVGQKMSDYPLLSTLTQEERETYMQNVAMTTFGTKDNTGTKINVNVPLSAIVPTVPVTDVTVGGTSVLNNGVAEVPAIPDAASLADGTSITASNGKLSASIPVTDVTVGNNTVVENGIAIIPKYYGQNPIMNNGYNFSLSYNNDQFELAGTNNTELTLTNPVPAPGTNAHRGEFLTVNNSDDVVWGTVPGLPDTTGHSQGDVLAIGVSGPDWTAPGHIPVIGTINITPAPSYNYIILQNFLDGHTIGTPISDSRHSDFYNQYPADISTLWYKAADWSDTNLVSTTANDQLLYSDNSFDFSKYGLTAGQVPFGFCKIYDIYDGAGYDNVTLPSEWTFESWFYAPSNDPWAGSFFEIGPDSSNLVKLFIYSGSISLFAMNSEVIDISKTVTSQVWHHVALSCDGTNLYLFYDGELLGTVVIASVSGLSAMLSSALKVMVNVDSGGYGANSIWYAQLALCDSCKWTDDFTPSKEAY